MLRMVRPSPRSLIQLVARNCIYGRQDAGGRLQRSVDYYQQWFGRTIPYTNSSADLQFRFYLEMARNFLQQVLLFVFGMSVLLVVSRLCRGYTFQSSDRLCDSSVVEFITTLEQRLAINLERIQLIARSPTTKPDPLERVTCADFHSHRLLSVAGIRQGQRISQKHGFGLIYSHCGYTNLQAMAPLTRTVTS